MVKHTNNLMSQIHIFKCFLEIMFFSVFLKFETDTSVIHELKAGFPSLQAYYKIGWSI